MDDPITQPSPPSPGPDPGTIAMLAIGLVVFFVGVSVARRLLRRAGSGVDWAKHAVAEGAERYMDTGRLW